MRLTRTAVPRNSGPRPFEKLRQSVAAQRTWCQGQRGQYTQMNEKLLQELRRAEEVIANNDLSGFDAMLESLQALEDTLQ